MVVLSVKRSSRNHRQHHQEHNRQRYDPLAKLPAEYGPRNLFARDRVVLGSLWWLSLPIWSIFPGAKRIKPAAVAACV
jgi:hypothetical protein